MPDQIVLIPNQICSVASGATFPAGNEGDIYRIVSGTVEAVPLPGSQFVVNPDGSATHTSADGTVTTLPAPPDGGNSSLTTQLDGTILLSTDDGNTYTLYPNAAVVTTDAAGNVVVTPADGSAPITFNPIETVTTLAAGANPGELTYTDEAGVVNTVVVPITPETLTALTAGANPGELTYTDEAGTVNTVVVPATPETVTALAAGANPGELTYTDEAGTVNTVVVPAASSSTTDAATGVITVTLADGSTFAVDPDCACVAIDGNGDIVITPVDGSPAIILEADSSSSVTDVDGIITVTLADGSTFTANPNCACVTVDPATGNVIVTMPDGSVTTLEPSSSVFSTPDANGKVADFQGDVNITGVIDPTKMIFSDQGGPSSFDPAAAAQFEIEFQGQDLSFKSDTKDNILHIGHNTGALSAATNAPRPGTHLDVVSGVDNTFTNAIRGRVEGQGRSFTGPTHAAIESNLQGDFSGATCMGNYNLVSHTAGTTNATWGSQTRVDIDTTANSCIAVRGFTRLLQNSSSSLAIGLQALVDNQSTTNATKIRVIEANLTGVGAAPLADRFLIFAGGAPVAEDAKNYLKYRTGINTTDPTANLSVNGTANKTGGGTWDTFSDERIKTDIVDYENGLEKINALRIVEFSYSDEYLKYLEKQSNPEPIDVDAVDEEDIDPIEDADDTALDAGERKSRKQRREGRKARREAKRQHLIELKKAQEDYKSEFRGKRLVSVIAQEAQKVFPNSVKTNKDLFEDQLSFDSNEMIFALVTAVQELSKEVSELKSAANAKK